MVVAVIGGDARVVVLLPPLPLRYLSSSCFAFGVRYFVYFFMFIFYFILFYLFNCKFGNFPSFFLFCFRG